MRREEQNLDPCQSEALDKNLFDTNSAILGPMF